MITYRAVGGDSSGRVVSSHGQVIAFCYTLDDAHMIADALNLWEVVRAEVDRKIPRPLPILLPPREGGPGK